MTETALARRRSVLAPCDTDRVADDLYSMAHHQRTGQATATPGARAGIGRRSVVRLIMDGAITVSAATIVIAGPVTPGDLLGRDVAERMAGETLSTDCGTYREADGTVL